MNTISLPANIVAFRDFLRERFPEAHAPAVPDARREGAAGPSWLEALHLGKGTITEVVAASASSGVGLLISGLLQRDSTCREMTALVDGSDSFDPWSVDATALDRLLWVRCRKPNEAIRASDLLLRDGNIPLVLLDLQLHPQRGLQSLPSSVWHRLRMLAEKSGTALCAFTPVRSVTCAQTRVRLEHRFELMDQYQERTSLLNHLPVELERQRPRIVQPAGSKAIA